MSWDPPRLPLSTLLLITDMVEAFIQVDYDYIVVFVPFAASQSQYINYLRGQVEVYEVDPLPAHDTQASVIHPRLASETTLTYLYKVP